MRADMDDLATWQTRLRQAQSEDGVVTLVNEFVKGFSETEMSSIPGSIRPPVFANATEVAGYNVQVLRYELLFGGGAEIAALLKTIVIVLTEASTRLSSLSLEARLMRPR